MKTFNQYCLLAAAMLVAGVANAQGPTNQFVGRSMRPVSTPVNSNKANPEVTGASARSASSDYNAYSQDSYISQTGSGNSATVDQVDSRSSAVGGGSTAILNQSGDNNNATQRQSLTTDKYSNNYNVPYDRNLVKATQMGSKNQSDQTQSGGGQNQAIVYQGAGTSGNRAIQTQIKDGTGGTVNEAVINQTRVSSSLSGTGNRAEQTQSGIAETARIDQESSNSYAKQTQTGGVDAFPVNSVYIHQGDPGNANTAIQSQNGQGNVARIEQSVGSVASNNYALQNQTLTNNQADITQRSSRNYAEQQQSGLAGGGGNYSSMTQSNVASAAYSNQSGNFNTAVVTQH